MDLQFRIPDSCAAQNFASQWEAFNGGKKMVSDLKCFKVLHQVPGAMKKLLPTRLNEWMNNVIYTQANFSGFRISWSPIPKFTIDSFLLLTKMEIFNTVTWINDYFYLWAIQSNLHPSNIKITLLQIKIFLLVEITTNFILKFNPEAIKDFQGWIWIIDSIKPKRWFKNWMNIYRYTFSR